MLVALVRGFEHRAQSADGREGLNGKEHVEPAQSVSHVSSDGHAQTLKLSSSQELKLSRVRGIVEPRVRHFQGAGF